MKKSCGEISLLLKALAHPQRLLILGHLTLGPRSVTDLVTSCGAPQSQVSNFLKRMKSEGLVQAKRDGRFVIYSIADKRLSRVIRVIHDEYCK